MLYEIINICIICSVQLEPSSAGYLGNYHRIRHMSGLRLGLTQKSILCYLVLFSCSQIYIERFREGLKKSRLISDPLRQQKKNLIFSWIFSDFFYKRTFPLCSGLWELALAFPRMLGFLLLFIMVSFSDGPYPPGGGGGGGGSYTGQHHQYQGTYHANILNTYNM